MSQPLKNPDPVPGTTSMTQSSFVSVADVLAAKRRAGLKVGVVVVTSPVSKVFQAMEVTKGGRVTRAEEESLVCVDV